MQEPLEGIHIKLLITFPGGHQYKSTVTPIPDNEELFSYTVDKFKKELWKDYSYRKEHGTN